MREYVRQIDYVMGCGLQLTVTFINEVTCEEIDTATFMLDDPEVVSGILQRACTGVYQDGKHLDWHLMQQVTDYGKANPDTFYQLSH